MENIIVNFRRKQVNTKNVVFFIKSCNLGLGRWYDAKLHKISRINVSKYEEHLWKLSLQRYEGVKNVQSAVNGRIIRKLKNLRQVEFFAYTKEFSDA